MIFSNLLSLFLVSSAFAGTEAKTPSQALAQPSSGCPAIFHPTEENRYYVANEKLSRSPPKFLISESEQTIYVSFADQRAVFRVSDVTRFLKYNNIFGFLELKIPEHYTPLEFLLNGPIFSMYNDVLRHLENSKSSEEFTKYQSQGLFLTAVILRHQQGKLAPDAKRFLYMSVSHEPDVQSHSAQGSVKTDQIFNRAQREHQRIYGSTGEVLW